MILLILAFFSCSEEKKDVGIHTSPLSQNEILELDLRSANELKNDDKLYFSLIQIKHLMVNKDSANAEQLWANAQVFKKKITKKDLLARWHHTKYKYFASTDSIKYDELNTAMTLIAELPPHHSLFDIYRDYFEQYAVSLKEFDKVETEVTRIQEALANDKLKLSKDDRFYFDQLCMRFYLEKGELTKGLDHAETALNYHAVDSLENPFYLAEILKLKANLLYNDYSDKEAIEAYKSSFQLYRKCATEQDKGWKVIYDLCLALKEDGKIEEGIEWIKKWDWYPHKKSWTTFKKHELNGLFAQKKGDWKNAVKAYEQALANVSSEILPRDLKDVHLSLGRTYKNIGHYSKAKSTFDWAIDRYSIKELGEGLFHSYLEWQIFCASLEANIKVASDSSTVEKIIEEAKNWISKLDAHLVDVEKSDALRMYDLSNNLYALQFEGLYKLYRLTNEQSFLKKIVLEKEKLHGMSLFVSKLSNDPVIKSSIRRLINQKIELEARAAKGEELTSALNQVRDSFAMVSPTYHKIIYADETEFTDAAMKYCEENKVSLFQFLPSFTAAESLANVISSSGIEVFHLSVPYEPFNHKFDFWLDSLHGRFFEPVEKYLEHKELIIISGEYAEEIPFDALRINNGSQYMLEEYSISYAYSIKDLMFRNDRGKIPENFNLIAYSFTDAETIKQTGSEEFRNGGHQLKELVGSYNECKRIKQQFGHRCKLVTGNQATKSHFVNNALDYDLVHLALHGKGNFTSLRNNRLYFREEYLENAELQNLNSSIDLLFLNACETNRGRTIVNHGSNSVSRAFAEIGVPSIITSLYAIDDNSVTEIVADFYRLLDNSYNVKKSLVEAKRLYLNKYKDDPLGHPFYWASLNLYEN